MGVSRGEVERRWRVRSTVRELTGKVLRGGRLRETKDSGVRAEGLVRASKTRAKRGAAFQVSLEEANG